MVRIYNTLSRTVEEFKSIKPLHVAMYSCGPTVYDYQHIGHMRRYVGDDILIRVLKANGYNVHHVMNITDVGHLVSDSDTGEDKMEKGAKKYGGSVWDIAHKFEDQFKDSCHLLNIQLPTGKNLMHATDYIADQIKLIQILEQKGYTYRLDDGIYFDTSKFPDYFNLSHQHPDELKKGARVDFIEGKKNASDFALWKFSYPQVRAQSTPGVEGPNTPEVRVSKRLMEWESPWGVGFPGWHIECSAMSLKALTDFDFTPEVKGPNTSGVGEYTIDIHTGGIDHIAIHHTNEIAQSECATGQLFVRYWVHHNFLVVDGQKMSKSLGNFYTVEDVVAKGYDPLSLRYLYLQTHYRQEMNFTWDSLDAAASSLKKLRQHVILGTEGTPESRKDGSWSGQDDKGTSPSLFWMQQFMEALDDDLNTAKALSIVWDMTKRLINPGEKKATLLEMDRILGLGLSAKSKESKIEISQEVEDLLKDREAFRKAGDYKASDELRKKIEDMGFMIEDSKEGQKVTKKK